MISKNTNIPIKTNINRVTKIVFISDIFLSIFIITESCNQLPFKKYKASIKKAHRELILYSKTLIMNSVFDKTGDVIVLVSKININTLYRKL